MNSSSNPNNNSNSKASHSNGNNNTTFTKPRNTREQHDNTTTDLQHFEEEDPNTVHYEEIRTILRHPEHCSAGYISNNNSNNPFLIQDRPKSEQLTSFTPTRSLHTDQRSQDDASTRYGRLLPSKIQSCSNSNDSLNANGSMTYVRSGSAEYISQQYQNSSNGYMCSTSGEFSLSYQSGNVNSLAGMHSQRARLRGGRFGNGNVLNGTQQGASVAGVPLHSLSSPESAYSTGYSTDGTSPGTIYTPPEYYINMRTGTHYFPKSVNSLAIEAQRYKFGLNKIEEMSPIDPMVRYNN